MDLDTAITLTRELGTNWARNGAPHQKDTGDALLLVVNAALEWQSLYKGPMPTIKPPTAIADAFTRAAQAAADHVAGGKPASIGRQQSERIVPALPLANAEGPTMTATEIDAQRDSFGRSAVQDPERRLTGLAAAKALEDENNGQPTES